MISRIELDKLSRMLAEGREVVWYNSAAWEQKRNEVLRFDHYECQQCKELRSQTEQALLPYQRNHTRAQKQGRDEGPHK